MAARGLGRFIPARAGNTPRPRPTSFRTSVHPRSRGEHSPSLEHGEHPIGSSPLARGTLELAWPVSLAERFIPARAGNTGARSRGRRRHPVHPRSRGEHNRSIGVPSRIAGSSPLARGTQPPGAAGGRQERFIPARAGNTTARPAATRLRTVHPRSRGEHRRDLVGRIRVVGSSPLARGTPDHGVGASLRGRFIPARAGNTGSPWSHPSPRTVHPRSRGEHPVSRSRTAVIAGSSPLARGTRHDVGRNPDEVRFIPARAGNTSEISTSASSRPVHPRSRGEHKIPHSHRATPSGSSPLARGTRDARCPWKRSYRFIPARAGNTPRPAVPSIGHPVHPRSRGEHLTVPLRDHGYLGSSPLARGTHPLLPPPDEPRRFIPARAGNTRRGGSIPETLAVHPRSRGEHISRDSVTAFATGSSPLARGTQKPMSSGIPDLRFIPARAGNTWTVRTSNRKTTVHPRSRGEHSFQNLLISQSFFDDNARTNGSVHIFNERETI